MTKRPDDSLTVSEIDRIGEILDEILPKVVPSGWSEIDRFINARRYTSRDRLRVIASVEIHADAREWLHVSLSRTDRIPSYEDCTRVKTLFVGRERKAFQVFAPESEHYNFHPNVLHLWSPIGFDPIGDLRDNDGQL